MLKTLKAKIEGVAPLIMHNGAGANPFDPWSRAMKDLKTKKNKTDKDIEHLAQLEFLGSLYTDDVERTIPPTGKIIIPGIVQEAMMRDAASQMKKPISRRDAVAGITCADVPPDADVPLDYDGPRDLTALSADSRFHFFTSVRIQRARIMSMRPMFRKWGATLEIGWEDSIIKREEDVRTVLEYAGRMVALCDWRPKHGRFIVNVGFLTNQHLSNSRRKQYDHHPRLRAEVLGSRQRPRDARFLVGRLVH